MQKKQNSRKFILLYGLIFSVSSILVRFGYIYDFDFSKLDFDFLISSFALIFASFFTAYLIDLYNRRKRS